MSVEDQKMFVEDQKDDGSVSPEIEQLNFDNANPTTSRSFQPIEQPNTPRSNFYKRENTKTESTRYRSSI